MVDLLSVFEQDDRYFKEHPGLSEYVREAVPGEFGGYAKMGEGLPKVLVVQLDDRMRIRIPNRLMVQLWCWMCEGRIRKSYQSS